MLVRHILILVSSPQLVEILTFVIMLMTFVFEFIYNRIGTNRKDKDRGTTGS